MLGRLENLRSLLVAASENPDRFLRKAAQPAPTRKMLTQALLAVGGIAVRAALDRALQAPAEHDYEI